MNTFSPPKRKLFELLGMIVSGSIFYLLYPSPDALILFSLGFIWNWATSNDLSALFDNRRYRYSMLRTVVNIQQLFLKPFVNFPMIVKRIVAIFPAGVFWFLVIYINDSDMPWWATFLGSAIFELMQLEFFFIKGQKESL